MISPRAQRRPAGFTLVEVMLVVAILAVVLAMGVPPLYQAARKEPMRKTVFELVEACKSARGRAVLSSQVVELAFNNQERTFSAGGTANGRIAESLVVEMLDVNLLEYKDADTARVRFFPNGTSDEFTLILHSDKNEWRKISLESTTGLATVGDVR